MDLFAGARAEVASRSVKGASPVDLFIVVVSRMNMARG
jgi:hypothetical protein